LTNFQTFFHCQRVRRPAARR